jgi:hypothetical protein
MLEPDWKQKRPTTKKINNMWSNMQFQPLQFENEMVTTTLTKMRQTLSDENCLFKTYEIPQNLIFDWYASRSRWDEIDFFNKFLTSPEVLNELFGSTVRVNNDRVHQFSWVDPLTLDGEVARILVAGSVYLDFEGTPIQAKELGLQFCQGLFQERYLEMQVYKFHEAWSDWFFEIGSNGTFIIIDKRHRLVHMLCYTDTD